MTQIQRIVPRNLFNQLKLQSFEIGFIEAKHANQIIQILKGLQTLPVDTFFLKRIRKNKQSNKQTLYVEVLLCITEQKQLFMQLIQKAFLQAFNQSIIKQLVSMQLPRFAPASKKDFEAWTKYWPCNFVEPQFVKKIEHSLQQLAILEELHKAALHQTEDINIFYLFSRQKYLTHFQGSKQQFTCKNKNPLEHPVMKIAQKWPQTQIFKKNQNDFYYFTGLRMLIKSDKLCGMCAMALVHCRIERLYFQQSSIPSEQILEILYSLKLNHKIELLRIKSAPKDKIHE